MKILILVVFSISLIGCATIPQGIAPTAKPLINEKGKINTYEILGKGEGSASHFSLFGFIPFGRADIDEAIQNAIESLSGDNLINTHYYVTSTWLFIGNSTAINVNGDVVKYTGTTKLIKQSSGNQIKENAEVEEPFDNQNNEIKKITKHSTNLTSYNIGDFLKDAQHKVTLGSAVRGLALDYTLQKPINKFLFYLFSIGYKYISQDFSYGSGEYRWNYTYSYSLIPITINIGASGKTFLAKENLLINPYVSIGLAYLPPEQWDAFGINLKLGAVYEIPAFHKIGLGLEYQYFSGYDGFSNLNLSVVLRP